MYVAWNNVLSSRNIGILKMKEAKSSQNEWPNRKHKKCIKKCKKILTEDPIKLRCGGGRRLYLKYSKNEGMTV